jgi:protein-glutamine gamma-glutamyltransferase
LDLQQRINLNLAAMAVLSATMVGMGQSNLWLPLGVALVAVASFWFCDRRGQVVLDWWVINIAVLGTVAIAVWRFAQVSGAPDAAVAADGLIGLQAVMMFERKTSRTHWDLFSLSLLQTFLACAFYHGPLFGLVLAIYLFFVLVTLGLLGMHRQQQRSGPAGSSAGGQTAYEAGMRTDWWQVAGVAAGTLIVGPLSLYLRLHPISEQREGPSVRPESGLERQPSGSRGTPDELDQPVVLTVAVPPPEPLGAEFWWRFGRLTLACLLIGVAVFLATPRFGGVNMSLIRGGSGSWQTAPITLQRSVGYDDQVRLGEVGSTLENTQKVLAVRLRRHRDNAEVLMLGTLFLRGAVLNQYTGGSWQWVPPADNPSQAMRQAIDREFERRHAPLDMIRQEFRVEPMDRADLFYVWPSIRVNRDVRVQFDPATERFQRTGTVMRRPFSYDLVTAELVDGQQTDLSPAVAPVELGPLLEWPSESFPALARLAQQWMDQANVPPSDPMGRARTLERALRSSPRFRYRLGEQSRDPTLDPIEDFIVNDPRGHCEYFASALALMLRSQGLPSRVAVGFKTDEFNQLDQRYWARQSHAHAWVEAYIPAEAIPAAIRQRHPLFDWTHGGWLRLDPTPSSLSELSLVEYVRQRWRDWRTAAQTAWTQHVMQMSGTQQFSLVYRPMLSTLRETVTRLGEARSNGQFSGTARQLFTLALPWIITASLALIAFAWWTLRQHRFGGTRGRRLRRSGRRWSGNGPVANQIEFYRRWETLLQQGGLERPPAQTPREFANHAASRLDGTAGQPQWHEAAQCVIDAFYQVRFGGTTLDDRQIAKVEEALQHIRQNVRWKPPAMTAVE